MYIQLYAPLRIDYGLLCDNDVTVNFSMGLFCDISKGMIFSSKKRRRKTI